MNRCPITYQDCGENRYSPEGLKKLSPKLKDLSFPYSAAQSLQEARERSGKMSIQGVQPKLSVVLNVAQQSFQVVDVGGNFIIKPQNPLFEALPENEDLSMKLAEVVGLEVPLHGLVYGADGCLAYFIKRFDRAGKNSKIPMEDFAQLSGKNRDSKYDSSIERLVEILDRHCTFPAVEKLRFFQLFLFNYLIGNDDMHLKNYALITTPENIVRMAPAYDLLCTHLVIKNPEESALSLNGKKRNLTQRMIFEYLASERLQLQPKMIEKIVQVFIKKIPIWSTLIEKSFLSSDFKSAYMHLLEERKNIL